MAQKFEIQQARTTSSAVRACAGRLHRGALIVFMLLVALLALAPVVRAAPVHPPLSGLTLDGSDKDEWKADKTPKNEFNHACGVATDSQGDVYVASAAISAIDIFDSEHKYLTTIPNESEPCGLGVDSKGNLYVSEAKAGNVVKYVPNAYPFSGAPTYGSPTTIDASGKARGVAVDPFDDRLYVAEGDHVIAYQSDGTTGQDEVQQVAIFAATGGTFTLTFSGQTTPPLSFDADSEEIEKALEDLTTIGAGNVSVQEGPFGKRDHRITFVGALASADVPQLVPDFSALVFGVGSSVGTVTPGFAFDGLIGDGGELTDATGIAAYAYDGANGASTTRYLAVADDGDDEIKLFAGKPGDADVRNFTQRQTIDGSETPDGSIGFGPAGAYLAADQANGHLFVYDHAHTVLDEFEATGQYLTQVEHSGFADAGPTATAVYPQRDEIQRLAIRANGGSFILSFKGEPTSSLAWNASPAQIDAALEALPAIGLGNVTVWGGSVDASSVATFAYRDIRFGGSLGKQDVPQIVLDGSALTRAPTAADSSLVTLTQGSGPGRLYASAGAGPGAKVLAFAPLPAPSLRPRPELSFELKNACGVDIDSAGDRYLATDQAIRVYPPTGEIALTTIEAGGNVCDIAVDSTGVVYALLDPNSGGGGEERVVAFTPDSFPPEPGTKYSSSTPVATPSSFTAPDILLSLGVNPANDHLFVNQPEKTIELDSAANGSGILNKEFAPGLGLSQRFDIAVYGANGNVYLLSRSGRNGVIVLNPAGTEILARITGAGSPKGPFGAGVGNSVAVDQSNGHAVFFAQSRGDIEEYEASGAFLTEFGSFNTEITGGAVAVDNSGGANDGDVFLAFFHHLSAFGPLVYGARPIAVTGLASNVGAGNATVNGTVDPQSFDLEECAFEYLTDTEYEQNIEGEKPAFEGAASEECAESPAEIGEGAKPVPVHADLSGLDPEERYRYRLFAKNEFGKSDDGPAGLFGPPVPTAKTAHPIAYTEATVRATIDPSGLATKYWVEYGNSEAYGQSTDKVTLAAASGPTDVEVHLFGLQEGTTYNFRFVLDNEAKTVTGPDQTLTTLERVKAPPCPNDALRTGRSASLPDCRAYELVTPADTGGKNPVVARSGDAAIPFFSQWVVAPSGEAAGDRLTFFTFGTIPGFDGNGQNDGYLATRAAGGWTTALSGPTYAEAGGSGPGAGGIAPDQLQWLWRVVPQEEFPGTLERDSYLRTPTGYESVGQGSLGTDPEAIGTFLSPGAGHLIFRSAEHLEPLAAPQGTTAIYDREAGEASAEVVSLKPDGSPFGAGEGATYVGASPDGSAALFKVGGVLYVRRGNSETVEVVSGPNDFAGISEDGKRVFYANIAESESAPAGLFACEIATGPCAGPGAQTPISIASNSRFVNVSADGSRVYFTSKDQLDEAKEGTPGEDNLYLWDGATTRFLAALDPTDFGGPANEPNLIRWARAISAEGLKGRGVSATRSTADGKVLVFQSHAQLTTYENEGFSEVYRYDSDAAPGEQLTCVSCDPTGASPSTGAVLQSPIANAPTDTKTIVANLTADGQKVFFETGDPLLPEDANVVNDVYEWEAVGSDGCTHAAGCLALISSGQGENDSFLYSATPDGHDVFFTTPEKLVGADLPGSPSIYDAREDGGIPIPEPPLVCHGDACQPQGSPPPVLPNPVSGGSGPEPVVRPGCSRGEHKVRVKGKARCVKKHHKKRHRHGRSTR